MFGQIKKPTLHMATVYSDDFDSLDGERILIFRIPIDIVVALKVHCKSIECLVCVVNI